MSDVGSPGPRIEKICDRFDAAWRSGKQPELSVYANELANEHGNERGGTQLRRRLLVELISVDMEYRANRGDVVEVSEYLGQFPELVGEDGQPPNELLLAEQELVSTLDQRTQTPTHIEPSAATPRCLDDYEIVEEIAHGGMGVVYKARDTRLKCDVALKTIRSGEFAGREEIERFRREAEAAAQLQHPGIVRIHRIGQSGGLHYFTMDFVEGKSLAQVVKAGPLPEREAIRFTVEVCEAVDYAHRHGILHRDIKPSNVLVNQSGDALITDFGLAKRLEENSDFSRTGQAMGTPGYMPPEQALGRKEDITFRSDVYAIGALLYHLLTGRPPFRGTSQAEVIREVLHSEPTPPHKINSKISKDLTTICMKCLEKQPARRYASAAELRDDLHRYANGFAIQARPVTFVEYGWRWYKRNMMVANLVLATCLAIVIGGATVVAVKKEGIQSRLEMARKRIEGEIATAKAKMSLSHGDLRPELVGIESDRLTEALQAYESVLAEQHLLFAGRAPDREFQHDLANLLFYDAQTTRLLQDFARSENSFLNAIKSYQALRVKYADDVRFPLWLGKSHDYLGELYRDHDRVEDADRQYRRSIEVLQECLRKFPDSDEVRLELARANNNFGILLQDLDRLAEARVRFANSETMLREIVKRDDMKIDYRRDLARSLINLGRLERIQENYGRAEELYLEATAMFKRLLNDHPKSERYKFLSATAKMNHGFMQAVYIADLDAGEKLLRESLSEFSELSSSIPEYRLTKAKCMLNLCQVHGLRYSQTQQAERLASAEEYCVAAHEILRDLHATHADVAEFDSWMGVVLGTLGWIADKQSEYEQFTKHLHEAIKFQRDAVQKRPRHREYKTRLQRHREFFVTRLVAAMDRGFETDFSSSRFDVIRDDPEFQQALQERKAAAPRS